MVSNFLEQNIIKFIGPDKDEAAGHLREAYMVDFDEVRRRNPRAAKELDSLKDALDTLRKLRKAGVTGREDFRPTRSRPKIGELKGTPSRFPRFKMTEDA